jgi:hypothetical protein
MRRSTRAARDDPLLLGQRRQRHGKRSVVGLRLDERFRLGFAVPPDPLSDQEPRPLTMGVEMGGSCGRLHTHVEPALVGNE